MLLSSIFRKAMLFSMVIMIALSACKKSSDDAPVPASNTTYQLVLKLNLKGANNPLKIGKGYFANAFGDSIQVRSLAFFISNVVLEDTVRNLKWVEKDSYHLAQFSADSSFINLKLKNLPDSGAYNKISFAIGLDSSANNTYGYLGKGDIILGNGMDWNWADGWKFFAMEGFYKRTSDNTTGEFLYHIGFNSNYRKLSMTLDNSLGKIIPQKGIRQALEFDIEAKEVFGGSTIVNVKQNRSEMGNNQITHDIANNYATSAFIKPIGLLSRNF